MNSIVSRIFGLCTIVNLLYIIKTSVISTCVIIVFSFVYMFNMENSIMDILIYVALFIICAMFFDLIKKSDQIVADFIEKRTKKGPLLTRMPLTVDTSFKQD